MGGGKIKIKRIEKYLSRGNGIMKKAKEISVLCGAKVSLVIFASSGNMLEYCSPSTSYELHLFYFSYSLSGLLDFL